MTAPAVPTCAIVIPARHASTRFPGKPLIPLRGANGTTRSLIERSWRAASAVPGIAHVVIATDDARIADHATTFGAHVVMTPETCRNGTERCAAALPALAAQLGTTPDIVINWQGDAPLAPPDVVAPLIALLARDPALGVATPAIPATPGVLAALRTDEAAGRVGGTSVVFDARSRALYFSKRIIPHIPPERAADPGLVHLHLGLYAYRPAALMAYAAANPSHLELLEGLEQLRFADLGIPVGLALTTPPAHDMIECNNPHDVPLIEAALRLAGID